jgi:hypothetical protein
VRATALFLVLTSALALAANRVSAQSVSGRLTPTDSTELPVGATVLVLDSTMTILRRIDADGSLRFRAELPRAGRYFIRVLSIGFLPENLGPIVVTDTGVTTFAATLPRRRLMLDGIKVEARDRCKVDRDAGLKWLPLWQQAREQVSSVVLVTPASKIDARLVEFRGLEALSESRVPTQSWATRRLGRLSPRVAPHQDALSDFLSSEELESYGVDASQLAFPNVVPLDATTLASDAFLASHCFGLENEVDDSVHWVGISFRPVDDGEENLAAVRGVLWLDAKSGELRRLDYAYSALQHLRYSACRIATTRCFQLSGAGASGSFDFIQVGTNSWYVSRWEVRTAPLAFDTHYSDIKVRPVGGKLEACTHGPKCVHLGSDVPQQRVAIGAIGVLAIDGRDAYRDSAALDAIAVEEKRQLGNSLAYVEGRIVDAYGAPISNAIVRAQTPNTFVRSHSSGAFQLGLLRATSQELTVEKSGFQSQTLKVKLKKNEHRALQIVLSRERH